MPIKYALEDPKYPPTTERHMKFRRLSDCISKQFRSAIEDRRSGTMSFLIKHKILSSTATKCQ